MAVVQTYEEQIGPGGAPQAPRVNIAAAGEGGRAIAELGQQVQGLGAALDRAAEQDAAQWSWEALGKAQTEWTQNLIDRKTTAEAGAPGFTAKLFSDFDQYADKTLAAAPDERSKAYLEQQLGKLRLHLGTSAMGFEAGERVANRTSSLRDLYRAGGVTVQASPAQFNDTWRNVMGAINAAAIDPATKRELLEEARRELSWSASTAGVQRDPELARSVLGPAVVGGRESYRRALFGRESSGGQVDADNPGSSAFGRYQFLEGTWGDLAAAHPELGLTPADRTGTDDASLVKQDAAFEVFTSENAAYLTAHGREANDANLYTAHFLGAAGADRFLGAAPDTPVDQVVGADALAANKKVFYRQDGSLRTAGEVYRGIQRRFPGAGWSGNGAAGVDGPGATAVPAFNQLTAEERSRLYAFSEAEINRRAAEGASARAAAAATYARGIEDYVAYVSAGNAPDNRYTREETVAMLGPERGNAVADEIDSAIDFGAVAARVATATPAELATMLQGQQGQAQAGSTGYRREAAQANELTQAIARRTKALADDPAGYAVEYSAPVRAAAQAMATAVDDATATPESRIAATRAYADAARAEQLRLGVPADQVRFLSDPQADALKARLTTGSPDEQLAQLAILAQGFGDDAPAVIGEAVKDQPVLAHAGALAAMGNTTVARDALIGTKALKDGAVTLPGADQMKDVAAAEIGTAFGDLGTIRSAVLETAKSIYAARALRQGLSPTQVDEDQWRGAVQDAAGRRLTPSGIAYGGLVDHNGARTYVPAAIAQAEFGDLVDHLHDEDVAGAVDARGRQILAAAIAGGYLVAIDEGRYLVSLTRPSTGSEFVAGDGPDGLFVLDLAALAPLLRERAN